MTNDQILIAAACNSYFLESVKNLTQSASEMVDTISVVMSPIADAAAFNLCPVSHLEIERIIGGLRNSRAKDAFGMSTMFIKTYKQPLIAPITNIINDSINISTFPD